MAIGQTVHQLRLRARQTFWPSDEQTFDLRVVCPVQGMEVPLTRCAECVSNCGIQVSAPQDSMTVTCCASTEGNQEGKAVSSGEDAGRATLGTISEIMATRVLCVSPHLPLGALKELFLKHGISGAPVVDEDGLPVGIVSKTDLVRHGHCEEAEKADEDAVVANIMTHLAFCLPANESIAKAAALMAFEGMHRVPIVGTHGEVVGIVSSLDIVRWLARANGYIVPGS